MTTAAGQQDHGGQPPSSAAPSEAPHDQRRSTVVDARLAALRARVGDRWSEEESARVRRAVERDVELAERLRRTPLGNADEPEIVFVPYRGEERGEGSARR